MKDTAILQCCLIVTCLLATVSRSTAQISAAEKQLILNEVGNLGYNWNSSFRVFDERYEGVHGTPLVYDDWRDGHVVFSDGREITYEKLFNMDATTGELLIVLPSNDIVALPSMRVDSAIITDGESTHTYVPVPSDLLDGSSERPVVLAQVLRCGDITLYHIPRKEFKPADYQGAYSPDRRYDEYLEDPVFFARIGDDFRELKLKKRQVVKALEDVVPGIEKRVEGGKFTLEDVCAWSNLP